MCQYQINPQQVIAVLAMDFSKTPVELGSSALPDGTVVVSSYMGKLNDLGFPLNFTITNSLNNDEWNYGQYPNPEIILLDLK